MSATSRYVLLHGEHVPKPKPRSAVLTVMQHSAVDLLAGGKNDVETADALSLHRVTVTRWRNYSPEFQAALTERRKAVWGAAADKLRALIPKALDTLAAEIESGVDRVQVALAVLKLAGPLPLTTDEPTDPEAVVMRIVTAEREALRKQEDDEEYSSILDGLPDLEDHIERVRTRLSELAEAVPVHGGTREKAGKTPHSRAQQNV